MARNRIFISYSHADADKHYWEEFQKYLRLWEDKGILDVWSDRRIQASQDWHKEIQQAIDSAGVAVLLISQDFLNSTYIREHELPPLLKARAEEKIALTCLFLRPSNVDSVEFADGQGNQVKLTSYQGLNPFDQLVSKYQHDDYEREQLLLQAAQNLRDLVRRHGVEPAPHRKPSGEREYELTICLRSQRNRLSGTYSLPFLPRFAQEHLPWSRARDFAADWLAAGALAREAEQLGPALFELLFGPPEGELCRRLLRVAFNSEQTPSPERQPLRVRIQTDDSLLQQLPWRRTSWNNRQLWESGWTFELLPVAGAPEPPPYADVQLYTPCEVLIVAPETPGGPLRSESHCRDLQQLFQGRWPNHPWPPLFAASRQDIEDCIRTREYRPHIIYYYGCAETTGGELLLSLGDGQRLTLSELAAVWSTHPPKVLFLNLVGQSLQQGIGSVAGLLPAIPFIAIQTTPGGDTLEARAAGIRWLGALLDGEDPVAALHAYGLSDAMGWTAYRRWQTYPVMQPTPEDLIEVLLDRHNQRALITDYVMELVHSRECRLQAVLVYGERTNLVERFSIQLLDHLKRKARDPVNIKRLELRLPLSIQPFSKQDIEQVVRRRLNVAPRESIIKHIEANAPERIGKACPVLLLDWKMSGALLQDLRLLSAQVETWLTFCRDELAHACSDGLRLLSYLALEPVAAQDDTLQQVLDALLYRQFLGDPTFAFELLPPLENVTEKDLVRYFSDRQHCNCPEVMRTRLPFLIYQATTGGAFDATVKLLRKGAGNFWHDLYDDLKQKWGKQCGIPDTED